MFNFINRIWQYFVRFSNYIDEPRYWGLSIFVLFLIFTGLFGHLILFLGYPFSANGLLFSYLFLLYEYLSDRIKFR